jgi:hypothetical protein
MYRSNEIQLTSKPEDVVEDIWPRDFVSITPPKEILNGFFDYILSKTTIGMGDEYYLYDTHYQLSFEGREGYSSPFINISYYLENSSNDVKNIMFTRCMNALTSPISTVRRNGARLCLLLSFDNTDLHQRLTNELRQLNGSYNPAIGASIARMNEMLEIANMGGMVKSDPSKYAATKIRLNYLIINADQDIAATASYTLNKINAWYEYQLQSGKIP